MRVLIVKCNISIYHFNINWLLQNLNKGQLWYMIFSCDLLNVIHCYVIILNAQDLSIVGWATASRMLLLPYDGHGIYTTDLCVLHQVVYLRCRRWQHLRSYGWLLREHLWCSIVRPWDAQLLRCWLRITLQDWKSHLTIVGLVGMLSTRHHGQRCCHTMVLKFIQQLFVLWNLTLYDIFFLCFPPYLLHYSFICKF